MKLQGVTLKNRRFIQAALILNAPAASLNLGENGIKRIYTLGESGKSIHFSYLSGQFMKSKMREQLAEMGEELSLPEIIQESNKKNTPTTSCNPFKYLDDDLFGYMNIIDKGKHINKGTTRVAPFKISYFLGKEGDVNKDYGVKQNGSLSKDGKLMSMPLNDDNRRFASTQYSGYFSIDLNCCGRFLKGHTPGWKNLSADFPIEKYESIIEYKDEHEVRLKKDIRLQRVQTLIKSLPYLSGGAKRTTIYSDLAPKFVLFCVTDCGNHLFQEISTVYKAFNVESFKESILDFLDNIKSDIYIAMKHGFLDEYRENLLNFVQEFNENHSEGPKFVFEEGLGRINTITKKFAEEALAKTFSEVEI